MACFLTTLEFVQNVLGLFVGLSTAAQEAIPKLNSVSLKQQYTTVPHIFMALLDSDGQFSSSRSWKVRGAGVNECRTEGMCCQDVQPTLWPVGRTRPRMAVNAAQPQIVNLLNTQWDFFVIVCHNVFNVWPKTTLFPVWSRDTRRVATPVMWTCAAPAGAAATGLPRGISPRVAPRSGDFSSLTAVCDCYHSRILKTQKANASNLLQGWAQNKWSTFFATFYCQSAHR